MMKRMILLGAIIWVAVLTQCTRSRKILAKPGARELAVAQSHWPESTAASLQEGYIIYTTRCNTCHGLKDIPSRSEIDWLREIDSMAPEADLTESEKNTLTHYILATREAFAK